MGQGSIKLTLVDALSFICGAQLGAHLRDSKGRLEPAAHQLRLVLAYACVGRLDALVFGRARRGRQIHKHTAEVILPLTCRHGAGGVSEDERLEAGAMQGIERLSSLSDEWLGESARHGRYPRDRSEGTRMRDALEPLAVDVEVA